MEEPMSIPNSIYCTTQWKGHVVQLPTGRKKIEFKLIFPWTKLQPFLRGYFQMQFRECFVFWLEFHWSLFLRTRQWYSTGLDNGLGPNRRQAIIWTNDDPIDWCVYMRHFWGSFNTLRPRQSGCHSDIFQYILLEQNVKTSILLNKMALKFIPVVHLTMISISSSVVTESIIVQQNHTFTLVIEATF